MTTPTHSHKAWTDKGGHVRCMQQPGDVPEVEPLVAEIHGVLQLLGIERPPLAAANTASIRQRGWTT